MANNILSCGPLTIKYLVFFFNLVFFLCGLAIVIVGTMCQSFFRENMMLFEDDYKSPAIAVIILGVAVMFISFFGCCGSKMESVRMLQIFGFLLGFLLICEIAGGIALAVMRSDIGDIIVKEMDESMPNYGGNNTFITSSWNNLQQQIKCCGTNNYTDWQATSWSQSHENSVPDSCCINETLDCGHGIFDVWVSNNTIFIKGCASSLKLAFIENLSSIVSVTVVLAIIEVIGLWMSCSLIKAVKESYEVL